MGMEIKLESWVQASPEQVFTEVEDETVVLNLSNSLYYGLDSVGTDIWKKIQQKTRVSDLIDWILDEYEEVEADQCRKDTLALLTDLYSEKLIILTDD